MASPGDLYDTLAAFSITGAAVTVLEDVAPVMEDLQTSQMAAGKRADGTRILPEYKESTVAIKSEKSGLAGVTDHVTLFDTGAFHSSVYVDVTPEGALEFGATDIKTWKLEGKYSDLRANKVKSTGGKTIFGLNEDSKELLKADTLPRWIEQVEKATGLKFT